MMKSGSAISSHAHGGEQAVAPFVDGVLSESESEPAVEVINPSNAQPCLSLPEGCKADVDRAVASARRAFESGLSSEAPPPFRKKTLHRLADLIAAEAAALDALDAGEMGKPIGLARANAGAAADLMRFTPRQSIKSWSMCTAVTRTASSLSGGYRAGWWRQWCRWNFPSYNAVLKVAPALAAGNCVVLKPSDWSSRSAIRIAHLALQAGLSAGVLNVVPGLGETVGRALGLRGRVESYLRRQVVWFNHA